jgi:hypothetical protein
MFGTDALKMARNPLRVIYVLEGLHQAEHLKMLKAFGLLYFVICCMCTATHIAVFVPSINKLNIPFIFMV